MHDPTESAQEGCVRKTWNVCTETGCWSENAGVKMLNSVDHITAENIKNERRARFTKAVELDGKLDDFLKRLRLTSGIDTEDQILKIFCSEDKKHDVEKALQIELRDITEKLHPFVEVVTTTTTAFSFERNKGEIAERKRQERLLRILDNLEQLSKDYVQEPSHEPGRWRDRLAVAMLSFAIVVLMIVVEVWLLTMIFPLLAPMLNHIVGARQSAMLIPIEDEGSLGNPSRDLRTLFEILKDGRDSRGEQEHLKDCLQDKYEPLCNFRGMLFKFDEDFSQALIELLREEGEFEALNVIGLVRNESLDLWIRKRYGQAVAWKIIFSGCYHYYWSIDTVLLRGWMHPDMERWLVKEVNTCNVMASVLNVHEHTNAPDEVFIKSLQETGSGTLALVGRSSSGKTSIMAELMRQYVNEVCTTLRVHAHFIGDAPGSTHVLPLVQRLCLVMCHCSTNVPDESKYLWDYRKLVQVFSEMLTAAATHVRSYFMLVLEALDQGKDAHKAQATMGLQPSPTVENWNIEKRLQIGELVFRK